MREKATGGSSGLFGRREMRGEGRRDEREGRIIAGLKEEAGALEVAFHEKGGSGVGWGYEKAEQIEGEWEEVGIGIGKIIDDCEEAERLEATGKVGRKSVKECVEECEDVKAEGNGSGIPDSRKAGTAKIRRDEVENTEIAVGNAGVDQKENGSVDVGLGKNGYVLGRWKAGGNFGEADGERRVVEI
jgi:hypothetical protein